MRIYTRTGDRGETSLFGGGRVPKDHPRVAAYGDVDELNSVHRRRRAPPRRAAFFDPLLEAIQRDLFSIGGHLATPDPEQGGQGAGEGRALGRSGSPSSSGSWTQADAELPPLRAFVLPGGHPQGGGPPCGAHRLPPGGAERGARSRTRPTVPELFLVYLNRLSDLLFTLARLANHREGAGDVTW